MPKGFAVSGKQLHISGLLVLGLLVLRLSFSAGLDFNFTLLAVFCSFALPPPLHQGGSGRGSGKDEQSSSRRRGIVV